MDKCAYVKERAHGSNHVTFTARLVLSVAFAWPLANRAIASPSALPTCQGPTLIVDSPLADSFARRAAELESRLRTLPDVDPCATIHLSPERGSVAIEVQLPDGRATERTVEEPQSLIAAVESLVTSLPATPRTTATGVAKHAPEAFTPIPSQAKRRFSLEGGLAASARIANAPTYFGYGISADASLLVDDAWVFGSWLRWDFQDHPVRQHNIPKDLAMASFLLGVFGGRRFAMGPAAVDLSVGPNLTIENQEAFEDTRNDVGGEILSLTLTAGARLVFPVRSSPRGYLLFAEECYLRRVGHEVREAPSLPILPAWSSTLALGMSWRAM